jgi:hypothetical protein
MMLGNDPKASQSFSSDVVRYLRRTRTLKEIGKLIGRGESFISLVGQGKRSFTIDHLIALEESLHKPLPLLILEASQETVPKNMRPQYEAMQKILERSGELRMSIIDEENDKTVTKRRS